MEDRFPMDMMDEAKEAVKRFASLPADKQDMALVFLHGLQIGESLAMSAAQQNAAPTA